MGVKDYDGIRRATIRKEIASARMNEIRKEIAWISSEYTKMFPTGPKDLDMVADNNRFHCAVLSNQLANLKAEIKDNNYPTILMDKLIIAKLEAKLTWAEQHNMYMLNDVEKKFFTNSFGANCLLNDGKKMD